MRVAMYYSNRDIRVEEMPMPETGPGELLVKVMASGICGSDVMEWYRIHKAPLVLGHEIAGEVAAVGQGVKGYALGDRISASHHVPCNTCHHCLGGHCTACETLHTTNFYPGGFAEYVRLPAIHVDRGVYRLPDEVSYEEATFIEPLACVVRAQRRARIEPGRTVLVLGSGISGLLHIHLARALGATRIVATDIEHYRLDAAKQFGADHTVPAGEDVPARLKEINEGRLADCVIVCTGAVPALQQALQSVERGGTVLFFAPTDRDVTIHLSINQVFWRNDVTLTTSYAGDRADHLTALKLIQAQRVKVAAMITHRLALSETVRGFELVAQGRNSIKVVIEPQR
jgi:L-iditol 2-dehydrogenase